MNRRCIILTGMPGAGKSTVGILLAKRLARPFVDVDVYIQAGADRTLQEIIDADGLEAFCRLESEYVRCLDLGGHVVATGGSVVYSEDAMRFLAAAGTIVYLCLPLTALRERLGEFGRRGVVMPPGQTLADLYARRTPLYERWADITIHCEGLDHQGVVDAVLAVLPPDEERA
jgi:shikimate kinase